MTSLGRLILFDQPGTGAADPVTPGALPTLELRADRERGAARPRTVALMMPLLTEMDVRAMLPTVRVPTLVLHHTDDPFIPPEWGKDVADRVSGARYVELRGRNVIHFYEPDWRASFQEIAEFLTGQQADVADDRVLATVLFTDIVDSTRRVAEIGDRDWHSLRDAHDAVVRSQLSRFRGREVNASGDGFLAMFDGPQLAIRCAMAIRDAVRALGIEVRAGLHTGEGEIRGDDIGGIAVHIGARVSALAGPNQVLVSSTLRDPAVASA
jgi:class 3 adenylate cyclase